MKKRAMIIKDYARSNASGVGDMLYYTEVLLSEREVPGESSICIFISGCSQNCKNCHYPDLQRLEYGDNLMESYEEKFRLPEDFFRAPDGKGIIAIPYEPGERMVIDLDER